MTKKRKIIIALILIFIAIGVFLILRKPVIEDITLSPPDVEFEVKSIEITENTTLPLWLNDKEIIYALESAIVSINIENLEKITLTEFENLLGSLVAGSNKIAIQTGLPFTEIKNYYIYSDEKLKEINLSQYEPVVSFSLSVDGNNLLFLGNYAANTNSANLYYYGLDTEQVDGPIFKNFPFSTIKWIDSEKALTYKFADELDGENIFLFDLGNNSLNQIFPTLTNLSINLLSPDSSQLLLSGDGKLLVKNLENISQTNELKNERFYGTWIDNQNVLITPSDTPINFKILNVKTKEEKDIEDPDTLSDKFVRSFFPSPDKKSFILRTFDNEWFVVNINTK